MAAPEKLVGRSIIEWEFGSYLLEHRLVVHFERQRFEERHAYGDTTATEVFVEDEPTGYELNDLTVTVEQLFTWFGHERAWAAIEKAMEDV